MSTAFITKRPHKKSRAGCKTCKTRKIKCDEIEPACTFCALRKLACVYTPRPTRSATEEKTRPIAPASSSSSSDEDDGAFSSLQLSNLTPSVMTSSGALSKNDMRLMFHWSTFTYSSVGVGAWMGDVLRFVVPQMAFETDFLMNGMLGIASLHQQRMLPDTGVIRKQTDLYRFKALSSFRKAVTAIGPKSPDYEAALVMTILLTVLCSQDYDDGDVELIVVRWTILYRGVHALITMISVPELHSIGVGPIFRRELTELKSPPVIPTVLMNMLAVIDPSDPEYEELPHYCHILDAMGMLYASLRSDGIGAPLSIRVISWLSYTSDPFARFAKENRPRALVILAHYLVFLKLVKSMWWIEGIADKEIKIISRMVGPKYASYMDIPLQAASTTNLDEVARLMLR